MADRKKEMTEKARQGIRRTKNKHGKTGKEEKHGSRRRKYGKSAERSRDKAGITVRGVFHKFKKGFGFIEMAEQSEQYFADGDERDIYVAASDTNGAMDGDTVEAVILPQYFWRGTRPEAQIRRVIVHSMTEAAGVFCERGHFGFVSVKGPKKCSDIFIAGKNFGGARNGDSVVCEITVYPTREKNAEGRITEIIARRNEAGADIKTLIRAYGYRKDFPASVRRQAEEIAMRGVVQEKERRDLRGKKIITIDGADSKDFDDAVSVEILENGNYLLGVHIADVSSYVTEDSPLDKEAFQRGTSIYLIDQVVPMLPEQLSNNLCSLRPQEDRLTLSVEMEISENGEVVNYEIYESVICSAARMVYDDVSDFIEGKSNPLAEKYAYLYEDIMNMAKLAAILSKKRRRRGSLDFDFDEASITLSQEGIPISVEIAERRTANRLIEEFMLTANETVAKHFSFLQVPFVYRIHEKPDIAKIEELKSFLRGFGISLRGNSDSIHPKALSGILEEVKGKTYENVVSTVMLRAMKKAAYDTDCLGHFGLSLQFYCHFTSPIRRYPDLIIHRIIKEVLQQFPSAERLKKLSEKVSAAAVQSSVSERRAVELERDVEKLKKAEYLSYHIGEIFSGIISGVTSYGIFVQLANTIEGMVRLEAMTDDFYDYEPERYRVIGRQNGRIYALGEQVTVKVGQVNIEEREIDFIMMTGQKNRIRRKNE